MDKAHKGSNACPRADHDYWVGGLEGQAELRLPYVHRNGGLVAVIRVQFVLQPVGGNSLVNASSLCFVFHHYCTDVDAVGVNLQKKKNYEQADFNSQIWPDFVFDAILPLQMPDFQIFKVIFR